MAIIFYIKTIEAREEWYHLFCGGKEVIIDRFDLRDSEICYNSSITGLTSARSSVNESRLSFRRDSLNISPAAIQLEVTHSPMGSK